jgi:PAS domain S-box-containing protein
VSPLGRARAALLAQNTALAAVYFAAGRLGLLLPIVQENVTLLWAPTGIALAAVLLFGPRLGPGIALGAFLVNLSIGIPPGVAAGIAAGNTLEALAGSWLLRRTGFRISLERVRDVLCLVGMGAFVSPALSAGAGISALVAGGLIAPGQALPAAGYWWMGDAMGILLVTPLILSWVGAPEHPYQSRFWKLEALALTVLLFAACVLTLGPWLPNPLLHPPLAFTVFPFLVWAALRFGQRGATAVNLLATAIAVGAITRGLTPFFTRGSVEERLVYLHTYMAVAVVTAMLLAAVFAGRWRAEEALRESEERLRLALEAGRYGVWDWDIRQNFVTWSERVYELHGVPLGEFDGRLESFVALVHPEDATRVAVEIERVMKERTLYQIEFRVVHPSGAVRWISTTGRVFFDAGGQPVRMIGATLDVTERHQAEEERTGLLAREREARAEAEAASEAKDRFLATLSHELRTPLTPVLAVIAKLEGDGRLRGLDRELAMIRRNVELEARLIDDLLDLTRITRGKLELHREVVDIRQALEHALKICCDREVASGRLQVEMDLAAEDHRIWADASRLTQVFWNLLSNAVKFTPAGGTITVRSCVEPGGALAVEVADTGVGIEPDELSRIFDAFEQGRPEASRHFGGLGLGLAITKVIVELHGGRIVAASEGVGRGSRFVVLLPAGLPRGAGAPAPTEAPLPKGNGGAARLLRILLVEDHADTAAAMAELLGLLGHRVMVAGSVAQGIARAGQALADGGLDLVVSDLGLPDGSGLDMMQELTRRYGLKGIALSGYGMEDDVRKSREAGFDRHLTKPVHLEALKTALQEVAGPERLNGL